jgi:DNA replication licensing factor MCM3
VNKYFLKKYIAYCKKFAHPILSQSAVDFLSIAYAELRKKGEDPQLKAIRKLPITVRTLETLIRLGTAHAKLRLAEEVTIADL